MFIIKLLKKKKLKLVFVNFVSSLAHSNVSRLRILKVKYGFSIDML